jgi:formate dehydrogenase subunit gamma
MVRQSAKGDDADVSDATLDTRAVQVAASAVAAHRGERGALLPVLHDVVAEFGHIPSAAVRAIAEELNLSRAEVHGVVSFYKDLRTEPPGRCVVQVCRGEACQSVGAERLVAEASERLGVALEATRADGAVSLEEVFCLGNCALGPSGMVDGRLYGRLTADRLCSLVERAS